MRLLFDILIVASLAAVLVTLALGLRAMNKGGDQWRAKSNKLMRLRIALQVVALTVLVTAFWWKSQHPG